MRRLSWQGPLVLLGINQDDVFMRQFAAQDFNTPP